MHAAPAMSPSARTEPPTANAQGDVRRPEISAANETSQAFIGGSRPVWMASSSSSPPNPACASRIQKTKPGRDKGRRKSSTLLTALSSHSLPREQSASLTQATISTTSSSTSDERPVAALPAQQAPLAPEDPAIVTEEMVTKQQENRVDAVSSQPHTAPASLDSLSTFHAKPSEVDTTIPHNPQIGNSSDAQRSAMIIPGEMRDDANISIVGSHSPGQPADPLAVAEIPPVAHRAAGTPSQNAGVRSISAFPRHRQSRPAPGISPGIFEMWRQTIVKHLADLEQRGERIGELERWRYKRLIEACDHNDIFFLFFHRLLCEWFMGPTVGSNLPANYPTFGPAFELLQQFFGGVSCALNPQHLAWFLHFPWDPDSPFKVFTFPPQDVQTVCKFLTDFAPRWTDRVSRLLKRRFPLTAYELSLMLECPSPVLRFVLFNVSWRIFGLPDGSVNAEMAAVYNEDVQMEQRADQLAPQDLEYQRKVIATRYNAALRRAFAKSNGLHAHGIPMPSMLTPASTPVSQQRTVGDLFPTNEVPSMAHDLTSFRTSLSNDSNISGFEGRPGPPAPVHQTGLAPHPRGQPFLYRHHQSQQPAPMQPSIHLGNTVRPRTARSISQNRQSTSSSSPLPLSVSVQAAIAPSSAAYPSFPSPVSASLSQTTQEPYRGFYDRRVPVPPSPSTSRMGRGNVQGQPVHAIPNRIPGALPTLPSLRPMRQESEAGERYSTAPLGPTEHPLSPYDWTSVQYSLHLPRSRSPDRVNYETDGARYYQFFSGFALSPTPICQRRGVQHFNFIVQPDEISRISKPDGNGNGMLHRYKQGSLRYRLRVIQRDSNTDMTQSVNWMASPTSWPEEIYFVFNNEPLMTNRKMHFHHDLPIELTDSVQQGLNNITVNFPDYTGSSSASPSFLLGVEVIITQDHASTRDMVYNKQRISADKTLGEICRRLQPSESDDVIIQDDSLCISLIDPFSASMFKVPVRGVSCRHIECFDLENWLQTRRSKNPQSQTEPSLADGWKCPICNGDAAPLNLRIDEFLLDVRFGLIAAKKGQTRSIMVHPDGSWTANEEPDNEKTGGHEEQSKESTVTHSPGPRREPECIAILDD